MILSFEKIVVIFTKALELMRLVNNCNLESIQVLALLSVVDTVLLFCFVLFCIRVITAPFGEVGVLDYVVKPVQMYNYSTNCMFI